MRNKQAIVDRLRKKHALKQPPKLLCLTMIVKNESANMIRLFDSLEGIYDMISIVDTGSTDNTVEIIETYGKKHKIPTKVHYTPFKNFGFNRTDAYLKAKDWFKDADYFLLSDADFVWVKNPKIPFDKRLLVEDMYLISQSNVYLDYWNIRILGRNADVSCKGRTHEYWGYTNTNPKPRIGKINALTIDDREDGGAKSDKFERDIKLLTEEIEDPNVEPGLRTRAYFYKGQTLSDIGQWLESVKFYKLRINDGGWPEEVFYSYLKCGTNYEALQTKYRNTIAAYAHSDALKSGKTTTPIEPYYLGLLDETSLGDATDLEMEYRDLAIEYYLKSYKFRKTRSEGLAYLAKFYQSNRMDKECYDICKIGMKIPYPSGDALFINRKAYEYLFHFELHIVCARMGLFEEGREYIEYLRDCDLTQAERECLERNYKYYL